MSPNSEDILYDIIDIDIEKSLSISIHDALEEKDYEEAAKLSRVLLAMFPHQVNIINKFIESSGLYGFVNKTLTIARSQYNNKTNKIIDSETIYGITSKAVSEIGFEFLRGEDTCHRFIDIFFRGYNNAIVQGNDRDELISDLNDMADKIVSVVRQYARKICDNDELRQITTYLCLGDVHLANIVYELYCFDENININLISIYNVSKMFNKGVLQGDKQQYIDEIQNELNNYIETYEAKGAIWAGQHLIDKSLKTIIYNSLLGLKFFTGRNIFPGGIACYLELLLLFVNCIDNGKIKVGHLIYVATFISYIRFVVNNVLGLSKYPGFLQLEQPFTKPIRDSLCAHLSPDIIEWITLHALKYLEENKDKSDQSKRLERSQREARFGKSKKLA